MRYHTSLAILLAAFWLLNSNHYSLLLLSLGTLSVFIVMVVATRMRVIDHESQPLHLFPHIFSFWFWLLKQIVIANIEVVCLIWRGKHSIEPTRLMVRTSLLTDIGKVVFANSITLTPGTVTLDLTGKNITIHSLSPRGSQGLVSLGRKVSKLET